MPNIKELIAIIPQLFSYFIPGYICIYIKETSKHQKLSKDRHAIIMSIIISFIIKFIYDGGIYICDEFFGKKFEVTQNNEAIILFVLSIVFGVLWSRFYNCKLITIINEVMGNKVSPYANVWNAAMESQEGAWAGVYLKDSNLIYIGKLIKYTIDPDETNKEILLTSFASYNMETRKLLEIYDDDEKMVYISCGNISNIEILKESVQDNNIDNSVVIEKLDELTRMVKEIKTEKDIEEEKINYN